MEKLKVGVLISGRGSNLAALLKAAELPDYPVEIVRVIANRPDAPGLAIAQAAKVPTAILDHKLYDSREAFDAALDSALEEAGVQLVCLAGFMRMLSPWFVARWRDRLINIHPSLLPKHKGLHTHAAVLAAGDSEHGCTVHFVRADLDAGPIILQSRLSVEKADTAESLAARVLVLEHQLYPLAVRLYAEGRVSVIEEKVFIAGRQESGTL